MTRVPRHAAGYSVSRAADTLPLRARYHSAIRHGMDGSYARVPRAGCRHSRYHRPTAEERIPFFADHPHFGLFAQTGVTMHIQRTYWRYCHSDFTGGASPSDQPHLYIPPSAAAVTARALAICLQANAQGSDAARLKLRAA